jgi:hypothetical protein
MLDYVLEVNDLTQDAGDYRAQVVNVQSFTQQDIVDKIMRIGAGLTRSDIAAVLEAEKQVIADIVGEGGAVTTELFNAFPSIQGVFHSPEDAFDEGRHKARINLHAGKALRDAAGRIKPKKVAAVLTGTIIASVTDVKTGSVNDKLTPGRDVKIAGTKLKLDGSDPAVGLYFVPDAGGNAVKVDASDVVVNRPSELIAVIPALAAGSYQVRIITQYTGGKALKTPHTVTFEKPLTV